MDLIPIDLEKRMLSHLSMEKEHLIKHIYIVVFPDYHKSIYETVFYSETKTEKIDFMKYGKSETVYYFKKGKTYKSLKWLLRSKNLKLKDNEKRSK